MAILDDIYIYPIKRLNAHKLADAVLHPSQGIAGDRAYAIALSNTEFDPAQPVHLGKIKFVTLMTHPQLAELRLDMAPDGRRIDLYRQGARVLAADLGRADGVAAFNAYMTGFLGDAVKGPVRLVSAPGHMFTDIREDCLSLINLASVEALGRALGLTLDPRRFRANLYVSGLEPWVERSWQAGDAVRLGGCTLEVMRSITRCAATNVNLQTARVDADVPKSLSQLFEKNLMGVYVNVTTGGRVAVGDTLRHVQS